MPQAPLGDWLNDFVALFYPEWCAACHLPLVKGESLLCTGCKMTLPETKFHLDPDNHVARHFYGRVQLQGATALYFFRKGSRVQTMIHHLKYHDRPEIGVAIGQYYGYQLMKASPFDTVDCIIPVPLHPKKEHKRGYNQAAQFARGLSLAMEVPYYKKYLIRRSFTSTQTRKSRIERWQNVGEVFSLHQPRLLEGKHILLVDDVVTTGATLEACALKLLQIPGVEVSVATIATAFTF